MTEAYICICDAVRTPVGRYGGALSPVRTDDLAAHPIKVLMARNPKADGAALDDVILGCANQAGEDNRSVARMAALLAGLGDSAPGGTVNPLCGSGLDAISIAARAIKAGEADIILVGGVESMSRALCHGQGRSSLFAQGRGLRHRHWLAFHQSGDEGALRHRFQARDGGECGRGIRRFARRPGYLRLQESGARRGRHRQWPVGSGDCAGRDRRPQGSGGGGLYGRASARDLSRGTRQAQTHRQAGRHGHGLTPRARVLGSAVVGVPPRIMGIGPAPATTKLLARLGLPVSSMDVIELNEAFAA